MTKSLTWLHECILQDCSIRCGTDTHRDIITMQRRVKHEGLSFLTITLPQFCKDFERSLEQGYVDSKAFLGFSRARALPRFLGGLLNLVFDGGTGRLLSEPSELAIFGVRQTTLLMKKVNLQCSHQRTKEAFDGFVQCENELVQSPLSSVPCGMPQTGHPSGAKEPTDCGGDPPIQGGSPPQPLVVGGRGTVPEVGRPGTIQAYHLFGRISDILWSSVLARVNNSVDSFETRPKHGPGATAEKVSGNSKYRHRRWHSRLQPYFPYDAFGLPSLNAYDGEVGEPEIEFVEPGAEQPVRVISVPKTLKSARIIAIEPVCMQYTQQALATQIVETLESHPLTRGQVNFSDQSINRELARSSSSTQLFGTLDLSEASDRVHKNLVYRMLQTVPSLRDAVFACRSTSADLGDGRILPLQKFASMGSALCFPIESMVFYTLCILARIQALSLPVTSRSILLVSRCVYVYGDDIIVPAGEVPAVARTLEEFSLKVNLAKTFRTGRFRESCGMDAYNGVDVTPVYARTMPPRNRHNATELVSYVSLANHLYKKGWWGTAKRVREVVEAILGPLPHVQETSPSLGWISYLGSYSVSRWDSNLHSWKVKGYRIRTTKYRDPLEGYGALMKFFLKEGSDPLDKESLSHSVRRRGANIKRGWTQPY